MNFYASREYLDVLAHVYFPGRRAAVEEVEVGGQVLRLLVVDGRKPITSWFFLDYHEPLAPAERGPATRRRCFVPVVSQRAVRFEEWKEAAGGILTPAPYVDWAAFPTYAAYQDHIKPRGRDLLREAARRRRRLEEEFGTLSFTYDDQREDVIPTSLRWKSTQLRDTQLPDLFERQDNVEFFHELRRRGLLVASSLRANERLLSAWLGFVHEGVWSGWIFAHDRDPALKKYSVGRQLLHSMLEESHRRGHRQFDFSTGDEDYKSLYATHARLLGPLGALPVRERVLRQVRQNVRSALERHPRLFEATRRVFRRVKNRAALQR